MTAVEDDIQEIATSIWETLFSAPLERTDSGFRCGDRTLRVSLHRGGPVEAT
ncbi:MAG: hypothetical protein LC789_14860 [Actinobacteria bacterium]|nr:hypothetical protein [Actinomycetota bacterium]